MSARDIAMWVAFAGFLGGIWWMQQTYMMRVDFNLFVILLLALSAAVVAAAWAIGPRRGPDDPKRALDENQPKDRENKT